MNTELVFVDVETTGLDPSKGKLLEVAFVRVDTNLEEICRGSAVIHHPNFGDITNTVRNMHLKSGLLDECWESDVSLRWAEYRLIDAFGLQPTKKPHMAGAGVGFDLSWLRQHMPMFSSLFHYRVFDVNTLMTFFGEVKDDSATAHRALQDVERDINLTRKYAERISANG